MVITYVGGDFPLTGYPFGCQLVCMHAKNKVIIVAISAYLMVAVGIRVIL